jgi:phosphatidylglycerophosphate synthase
VQVFDARIRRTLDPLLDAAGTLFSRAGLSANAVTALGFLFGCGAWIALAYRQYSVALAFIALNRIADGLDGAIARRLGSTDLGGYLDITLDFIFYAGVPFFFAVGRPDFALAAAFLAFSFVGTGSSFLAFSVIAAKRGLASEAHKMKSIYYLGGLTEGAETVMVFVLICVFPEHFEWFAWIFGGLCWVTTATRIASAIRAFRERPPGIS